MWTSQFVVGGFLFMLLVVGSIMHNYFDDFWFSYEHTAVITSGNRSSHFAFSPFQAVPASRPNITATSVTSNSAQAGSAFTTGGAENVNIYSQDQIQYGDPSKEYNSTIYGSNRNSNASSSSLIPNNFVHSSYASPFFDSRTSMEEKLNNSSYVF